MKDKIEKLVYELNKVSDIYYNTGIEAMDDKVFDEKIKLLKKMEEESNHVLDNSRP